MRQRILDEIRRLSLENDGQVPGVRSFARETGIPQSAWRGVHWARWGDAVKEAGFEPNKKQGKIDEQFLMKKLAEACRSFGRFPTAMELRMYRRNDAELPYVNTVAGHFGSLKSAPRRLAEWAKVTKGYEDLLAMLPESTDGIESPTALVAAGLVYLIRSGDHYKIGRSDNLERRIKEIRIALPESATLTHTIQTDDPSGIEAYWHRRFANRRANGEWFKLTMADVAAFKRRKYQ